MELFLVLIAFIVSMSWSTSSTLVKEGLYYTSIYSSILIKSIVFFIVSMGMLLYLRIKNKKIDMKKVKMALKYFPLAAALTYFVGTLAFLNMIKQTEKISLIVFLQSVFVLLLVSILSYFILGERLTRAQILGIIIGLIGTAIIIFNSNLYKKN